MLVQSAIRFNDDSGGDYVAVKAPTGVTTHTLLLPAAQGAASTTLTNDGSGNLSWAAAASATLNQYNTDIGNSSNSRTATNTNLLGDAIAKTATATITMTIAAPGVVTWTTHGLTTYDKVYFTTSGALPTGVSASTTYYITTVDANSFKLSTTLANALAGTFITTTGSQSGVHSGFSGGFAITDASATARGLVNTTTQTIAGAKTLSGALTTSAGISNSGGGITSSVVGNQFSASSNTNGTSVFDIRNSNSTANASTTALSIGLVGGSNMSSAEFVRFYDADGINSQIGSITSSGGASVAYNTSSDRRLKDNIVDLDDALSLMEEIKPRRWIWKKDGAPGIGFIAQELIEVHPDAVTGNPESELMMAVDYSKLTPILAAAIKELMAKNVLLEKRIEQLENLLTSN